MGERLLMRQSVTSMLSSGTWSSVRAKYVSICEEMEGVNDFTQFFVGVATKTESSDRKEEYTVDIVNGTFRGTNSRPYCLSRSP